VKILSTRRLLRASLVVSILSCFGLVQFLGYEGSNEIWRDDNVYILSDEGKSLPASLTNDQASSYTKKKINTLPIHLQ